MAYRFSIPIHVSFQYRPSACFLPFCDRTALPCTQRVAYVHRKASARKDMFQREHDVFLATLGRVCFSPYCPTLPSPVHSIHLDRRQPRTVCVGVERFVAATGQKPAAAQALKIQSVILGLALAAQKQTGPNQNSTPTVCLRVVFFGARWP